MACAPAAQAGWNPTLWASSICPGSHRPESPAGASSRGGRLALSRSRLRAHVRRNRVRSTAAIASQQRARGAPLRGLGCGSGDPPAARLGSVRRRRCARISTIESPAAARMSHDLSSHQCQCRKRREAATRALRARPTSIDRRRSRSSMRQTRRATLRLQHVPARPLRHLVEHRREWIGWAPARDRPSVPARSRP